MNSGIECKADVGMAEGENIVQLNSSFCMTNELILHEVMHKLGFEHINNAPDRDLYIKINDKNIPKERKHLYLITDDPKLKMTDFGLGYDFDSVMSYRSKPLREFGYAMEALTSQLDTDRMGQAKVLSVGDVARIRALYNCDGDHPELEVTSIK